MKRKIYWNICLAALFSMVLSVLIAAWLLSRDMQTQMRQAVAIFWTIWPAGETEMM